jgi:hypothetical protein
MQINVPRIIALVAVAAAIAGMTNLYADAGPIERMARKVVCDSHDAKPCRERLGRVARTPFFHDYQFTDAGRTVNVRCARSFYLVGERSCRLLTP